ncbi:carbohydrate binding domain-containing protein [Paenibacillus sp. MBLB4367]|uniref:carbohydrate binding domain-containing protein n=1 Tax=Paenibacillus sp. MBLB4367 TaxID=3384767 RepID=UPI0039080ACF
MVKKVNKVFCMLLLLVSFVPLFSAQAADMLIPNYSFESGLTSWTQNFGSGGISVSSDTSHSGTNSLKIVDTSNTSSVGIQSDYMAATAGKTYYAYAWANIASGSADLYIRFYNSSKTLLSSAFLSKSGPVNQWSLINTSATAPTGTAYVAVLLYSNNASTGTVYWDDVLITAELTNLGNVVYSTAMRSATVALDGNGKPAFYIGVNGSSTANATMAEVNLNTGVVQKLMPLPNTTYAHSAATTIDNKVYMGTYPNGLLYQYTPGTSAPVNLGKAISDATYIYALSASDLAGKVYGGTYPYSGVFKYEPGAGFYTFSPHPFFANSHYTYSIVHDAPDNVLYVGTGGTKAQISRLENVGGQRNDNLLPASIADANTAVDKLSYEGGKVFARVIPENKEVVLDVTDNPNGTVTTVVDAEFPIGSYGVSPIIDGKVYYTYNGLKTYDVNSKTIAPVLNSDGSPAQIPFNGYAWGLATLDDQVNYPGQTLVSVGHTGGTIMLFKYNPTSKISSSMFISGLPGVPTDIRSLTQGPDQNIYAGGFLSGNMGVYSPMRSDRNTMHYGIPQIEGMISQGNTLYMGGYPNAQIYKNDMTQGWGPTKFLDLGTTYLQERPYGMAQGDNKIIIGTVPASGQLGGALTVYDSLTASAQVYRNIVPNQSIISSAYLNGYAYGGSSIAGGKNTTPTETQAKLVKLNVATGAYTTYSLPFSSPAITALIAGTDGKIWGLANGYLFIFNPATNTIEYYAQKFTDVNYGTAPIEKDGSLVLGRAGSNKIYGTIKTHLFEIDTTTRNVTILYNGVNNFENATADGYGNIYFNMGNQLFRWAY